MALAARNIPSVVFIPDVEPGLALNVIMRTANKIAMSTDQTKKFIENSQKAHVTGYPLRKELKKWSRHSAREFFGIGKDEKVLLVFGGSKGARSINDALFSQLAALTKEMHVIHIAGKSNWDNAVEKVAEIKFPNPEKYHAYPFLEQEMGAAFAAADLVVCRAGASTIGELPYFGLPAILVPYPHAWRYQHQNAEYLVSHGGAILLKDEDLPKDLFPNITDLMRNQARLSKMRRNMHTLAAESAAEMIAEIIFEAGSRQLRGSDK
jgi:UDP-N-acetylglucosamine--N-acetylmuramyl-(pentapeptide) pyrophosphoryl-undecaprenol N-acetylglucosamine transferase